MKAIKPAKLSALSLFAAGVLTGFPAAASASDGRPGAFSDAPMALQRGVWEVCLTNRAEEAGNPFFDVAVDVVFTRPDGSDVKAEGFFKGAGVWACRAYCQQAGAWRWRSASNRPALDGQSGAFEVEPSHLPGKLRKHPDDPHQFATDDGAWFLHLGDTGYRYVADTEPLWQNYIDEAAQVGFTKIRTWFCRGRNDVGALLAKDRQGLDLAYWDEIERRLCYALEKYPHMQLQLIPFGEDWPELARYGKGDPASLLIARYAQARFTAFPNVHWCLSNDSTITAEPGPRNAAPAVINRIGRDMRAREPWGTLLTNHQGRFLGYSFADSEWSDIVTLEDRDQVAGELIRKYRASGDDPVVLDEDRYGIYISPRHDRYYFRRLMWASLLSGGHATYGGLETYEPFAGADKAKGVQGYLTAVKKGLLDDGAADFAHIARFFSEAKLTLAGLKPADGLAGARACAAKVIAGESTVIAYLQNPDGDKPEAADVRETPASCRLALPEGAWRARWYDPRSGQWHADSRQQPPGEGAPRAFTAPFPGDAVLLLERLTTRARSETV